jgi:hypothetical protein
MTINSNSFHKLQSGKRLQKYLWNIKQQAKKGQNSSMGKILFGLYKNNKDAVLNNKKVINTKLIDIIAKPETLLMSYRAISSNKGALLH